MSLDRDAIDWAFQAAADRCEAGGWSEECLANLFSFVAEWLANPAVTGRAFDRSARMTVLHNLTEWLSHPKFRTPAWEGLRKLASMTTEEDHDDLRLDLTIATFELIAEPPEVPGFVESLFGLLDDPATRWAVFGAYERWPGRFRKHIKRYAGGRVTEAEFCAWLREQGLTLAKRGIRREQEGPSQAQIRWTGH